MGIRHYISSDSVHLIIALQEVLKKAMIHDSLSRGFHEVTRIIVSGNAELCIFASSCDVPRYTQTVEALCQESGIVIVDVDDKNVLGNWCGLRKVVKEV